MQLSQKLINTLPHVFYKIHVSERCTLASVSQHGLAWLGYTMEDLKHDESRLSERLIHQDDREFVSKMRKQALGSESLMTLEYRLLKPINAIATDISNCAIATAMKGKYHLLKMEEYEKNYGQYNPMGSLAKYYTVAAGNATMDSALIRHVTFEHHNLITGSYTRKFDIIFCRNVMIYFDNKLSVNSLIVFTTR